MSELALPISLPWCSYDVFTESELSNVAADNSQHTVLTSTCPGVINLLLLGCSQSDKSQVN